MKPDQELSTVTRSLHIIIAVAMIGLIIVGIYMTENKAYPLYNIHKSLGFLVLFLASIRIVWRIREGWPSEVAGGKAIEHIAAKVIHWVLIISTLLFPISGLMMSVGGGHGLSVFGLELIAASIDPVTENPMVLNESVVNIGLYIHSTLMPIIIFAIVMHVVGALKHHYIDKDSTLKRMFWFKK
ncbi:Cytochrome B561 [Moritella sp. JT01]|uniref:cytochrome b n=1 Tax=Moritella sp. JT01 TaxID=756698 RepID=UPI00079BA2D4|nr:cytochrome b [Moritella sp. JT01]KXO10633.1 Cytochrome B561 [Moritella sp. JT01]